MRGKHDTPVSASPLQKTNITRQSKWPRPFGPGSETKWSDLSSGQEDCWTASRTGGAGEQLMNKALINLYTMMGKYPTLMEMLAQRQ